ncbi:TPA: Zn-dependent oxidoreductase [Escherichia coli]|nr:Zn-dependent oxidoreductase [Escherichia coli]
MNIVKAEVFVTCPGRNFVTLKITTEDGITGLGDATLNGRELSVASYLQDHLCPQLIGRDAHRIEDIWQFFYKGAYWRRGPVTMSAISAVDMALWDIKAKAANMPLYQLLGGASREGVMVYCHTTGHSIDEAPNQLAIIEREIPTPSAGEVRVKVKLAGICGSDSHIYRGHNPFAKYPRVIGHEFFGVIDAVGEGVESARVGERVAVDPVVSCGHCYPCSIGKPNVCTTLAVLGVHADGGFSEYAVVPAKNAWKIPEAVADQYAVMIEPFTIAANVTGHGQPTENDTVLVYGAGPIGLTIVQVLKGVYNVKNVIVADRIDERLEKAKESGADWAINNSQTPLGEIFAEKGIKPTLIIDAACHPSILKEAVTLASPAARIVLMGFSSEPSEVIQQGITGKELSIFSSRLNANKFPVVIDWLSKGLIKPEKLITHTFDFQHVADAISLFEQDQKHCCKVLLTFSE